MKIGKYKLSGGWDNGTPLYCEMQMMTLKCTSVNKTSLQTLSLVNSAYCKNSKFFPEETWYCINWTVVWKLLFHPEMYYAKIYNFLINIPDSLTKFTLILFDVKDKVKINKKRIVFGLFNNQPTNPTINDQVNNY